MVISLAIRIHPNWPIENNNYVMKVNSIKMNKLALFCKWTAVAAVLSLPMPSCARKTPNLIQLKQNHQSKHSACGCVYKPLNGSARKQMREYQCVIRNTYMCLYICMMACFAYDFERLINDTYIIIFIVAERFHTQY